jgi:hypothetical protein
VEMDNIMFIPIRNWVMSQNNLLIHLLELEARKKWMEKYMDELIGARSVEKRMYEGIEEEFGGKKEEKKGKKKGVWDRIKPKYYIKYDGGIKDEIERVMKSEFVPNRAMRIVEFFVKPGPYEPIFRERISKMYMRASGFYFKQITDVLKTSMGIE